MIQTHHRHSTGFAAAAIVSAVLAVSPVQAQVVLDGSTLCPGDQFCDGPLTPMPLGGPDFAITEDLGKTVGGNLFHSFDQFTINPGESATFSGSAGITNVISRVTGDMASTIDGPVNVTIDGANFFLVNDNGISVGPTGTFNVSGDLVLTTANSLHLGVDGHVALTTNAADSVLTASPPSSFGFMPPMGETPAPINLTQSQIRIINGNSIRLIGGEVNLVGFGPFNRFLQPPPPVMIDAQHMAPDPFGGRVDLVAVGSAGTVTPSAPGDPPAIALDGFGDLGPVSLSQGVFIDTTAEIHQTVFIRGASLSMTDGSTFAANQIGAVDATAPFVDIDVTGSAIIDASIFQILAVGPGRGGDLLISADRLEVINGSEVVTGSFNAFGIPTGSGQAGNVEVHADSVVVAGKLPFPFPLPPEVGFPSALGSGGTGGSSAEFVRIYTGSLEVLDGGTIAGVAEQDLGNGSNIEIVADSVLLSSNDPFFFSNITGSIGTDPVPVLDDMGNPNGAGFSAGDAGSVTIISETVTLLGRASIEAVNNISPTGSGGHVVITTDRMTMDTIGGIASFTVGSGPGGDVDLTVSESLIMRDRAGVLSSSVGTGDAGDISISGGENLVVELHDQANLFSLGGFGGDADGVIFPPLPANSGDVDVTAHTISIISNNEAIDPMTMMPMEDARIVASAGEAGGDGGTVTLHATEIVLDQGANISAATFGPGLGGQVDIHTGSLEILGGSTIATSTLGPGDARDVTVNADSVVIAGVGAFDDLEDLGQSVILSQSIREAGDAGDVFVNTRTLEVLDGASITTNTTGPGNSGRIMVDATESVLISGFDDAFHQNVVDALIGEGLPPETSRGAAGFFTISTDAFLAGADGDAGDVSVTTMYFTIRDRGLITSQTNTPGIGGDIVINAYTARLETGGTLSARSFDDPMAGIAGDISINADMLISLNQDGLIETSAETADGGDITLVSWQNIEVIDSLITAEAGGSGGDIKLTAPNQVLLQNSVINAQAGIDGGNISIDPLSVILNNSQLIANAILGNGGNITIVTDAFLVTPNSQITASSQFGVSGSIAISSPDTDLAGSLARLPGALLDAQTALAQACAAKVQADTSSFVLVGRGGLPIEPGGTLPGIATASRGEDEADEPMPGIEAVPEL